MRRSSSIALVRVALGLLAATLACPAAAQEGPRVAVAPFSGRNARTVQRQVERVVGDRAALVDSREVERAAREAGVRGTDPDGAGDLASAVGAELLVQGAVSGPRRSPSLALVVRGPDGRELARGDVPYRGRRGREELAREVGAVLERAERALAAHGRAEPEPMAPPVTRAVPDSPRIEDGLALFSILAGVSVRHRDIDVQLIGGGTRRYASDPYPELVLGFEARPFALESHLGRGLFVNGTFAHSLGLDSEVMGTTMRVPTNFVRVALGAGWLAPLGDVAELGLGLSFTYDGYHLAPNVVLPTAEYVALRPGVRARIRLARETVVLELEAAYRGVLGIGALAQSFGDAAGAHGVDVGVGVGGNLIEAVGLGFTWAVRLDWVGYFLDFGGVATDALGRSGTESGLRVTALIGWSFR